MTDDSINSEQALIGGVLLDDSRYQDVADIVGPDDFSTKSHKTIWQVIQTLVADGVGVDIVTVSDYIQAHSLGRHASVSYLGTIARDTPSASNVASYARTVRQASIKRDALRISADLQSRIQSDGVDAVDDAVRELMNLSGVRRDYSCSMIDGVKGALETLDEWYNAGTSVIGVSTGLTKLDENLGGLHDSDLIIIGARPAMGKTAVMLNMAINSGASCGVISGEQARDQMGMRYLGIVGKVSVHKMRRAKLDEDDWSKMTAAASRALRDKIYLYDKPGPTIDEVVRQARRWKHDNDIKVLFVDYLQKIRGGMGQKRHEQVGDVVSRLKDLARELDIPVVALAQVKRDVESRGDKRPMMGDISDSSEIEKESDVIMTLYRDEAYNEDSPHRGIMELVICKNRSGPTGKILTTWQADYMLLSDLPTEYTRGD